MKGGFVKVGWERKRDQGIRVQEWAEKGNWRHFLDIFGVLAQGPGKRGRETNVKVSNEGIANGVFGVKSIQKTGIFGRFIGLFGRKKVVLEGGFRRLVRKLWIVFFERK